MFISVVLWLLKVSINSRDDLRPHLRVESFYDDPAVIRESDVPEAPQPEALHNSMLPGFLGFG